MINIKRVGEKIVALRKQHNMTQTDLSEQLYVSHQAISKWETGKSIPSIELLYDITQLFSVSIDYLLDDDVDQDMSYSQLFQTHARETVINHFYQQNNLDEELPKLFYLLNKEERELIINQLISETIDLSIPTIWPLLNLEERQYLLSNILTNKVDFNLTMIFTQLTPTEQLMAKQAYLNQQYQYPIKGVVINEN